jgi:hypothetical protein
MGDQPKLSPEDVVFTEATPAQQKLAWELNGVSWATPMSIPDYVRRETHLSQQELSKDGGSRYWILHPKGQPNEIVAGCECTRKTIFVRPPGPDSAVADQTAYAIASVYTNPAYRRLGMAARMLHLLQGEMDRDSAASALYSDIGKLYYAQLGWPPFPSQQATLLLLKENAAFASPADTKPLTLNDLPALCARDAAGLRARLSSPDAHEAAPGATLVAFAPTFAQLAWQLARVEFMAGVLHPGREVQRRGAMMPDGRAWVVWDHDWREKKLKIARIAAPGVESGAKLVAAVTALLQAALEEASAWGLGKVLVWNPDVNTTLGIKGVGNAHEDDVKVVFDERIDGSIPSFRWRGGQDTSSTVWVANEYYAWC